MRATRSKDTRPEIRLRQELHALGLRYRVNKLVIPSLRRRADVVFGPAKVAVYMDGCFWHGCEQHVVWPRRNADWWRQKIKATQERDADTDRRLIADGWLPIRIWEHDDVSVAAARIAEIVRARRDESPN
jgi:DNA mismatch endonuclease (patch repair protein)